MPTKSTLSKYFKALIGVSVSLGILLASGAAYFTAVDRWCRIAEEKYSLLINDEKSSHGKSHEGEYSTSVTSQSRCHFLQTSSAKEERCLLR
jgi:hypothetical protein